jgi:hypothetical protein
LSKSDWRSEVAQAEKNHYLCRIDARMAESVDATVSNTVGATHPGSSPGPGTETGMLASSIPVRVDLKSLDIFEIRELFAPDKVQKSQFGGIGKYG